MDLVRKMKMFCLVEDVTSYASVKEDGSDGIILQLHTLHEDLELEDTGLEDIADQVARSLDGYGRISEPVVGVRKEGGRFFEIRIFLVKNPNVSGNSLFFWKKDMLTRGQDFAKTLFTKRGYFILDKLPREFRVASGSPGI